MTKILFVGEAWGEEEERQSSPFVGPSGRLLRHQTSKLPSQCSYTNIINLRPPNNDFSFFESAPGKLKEPYLHHLDLLKKEVADATVVVALGSTALWYLTGKKPISSYRGVFLPCHFSPSVRVIATWHPAAVLRNWSFRQDFFLDIKKAENPSEEFSRTVFLVETLPDMDEVVDKCLRSPLVACDIETAKTHITCVGFAPSPFEAFVIPFTNSLWTPSEEVSLWQSIRQILNSCPILGQNFSYDVAWLWGKMGIPCRGYIHDTMILQSALHPEQRKSLGYLASIYTNSPEWKTLGKE